MKKRISTLALALALMIFSVTSSSWALTYVPDYGETGWRSFSYTTNLAAGTWDYNATLTFGVNDALDNQLPSVLLVDNVLAKCNFGGNYTHYADSFDGGLGGWTTGAGYGSATTVSSATSHSGNNYSPTDGTSMAQLVATQNITSGPFAIHGADLYGSYGPTTISFDWAFLAMDYIPYEDFSWVKLNYSNGSYDYFDLAQIGTAPVPEPSTFLLLGVGMLGAGLLSRRFRRN